VDVSVAEQRPGGEVAARVGRAGRLGVEHRLGLFGVELAGVAISDLALGRCQHHDRGAEGEGEGQMQRLVSCRSLL